MAKEKRPAEDPGLAEVPYEGLVAELDGVVKRLEAGELSLEESLRAFERGVKLAQAAESRLDAAEQRVEVLLQGDKTAPLPPMEEGAAPRRAAAPASKPVAPDDGEDDVPF